MSIHDDNDEEAICANCKRKVAPLYHLVLNRAYVGAWCEECISNHTDLKVPEHLKAAAELANRPRTETIH